MGSSPSTSICGDGSPSYQKEVKKFIKRHKEAIILENRRFMKPFVKTKIVTTVNNQQKDKIYQSISSGSLEEVQKLFEELKIPVTEEISVPGYNWTTLHYASFFDKEEILKFLLERYENDSKLKQQIVNLDIKTSMGYTPLMIAAINNNRKCVLSWLHKDVDVLNVDNLGRTARALAHFNLKSLLKHEEDKYVYRKYFHFEERIRYLFVLQKLRKRKTKRLNFPEALKIEVVDYI